MTLNDRQERRLYSSIDTSGDCWIWTGTIRVGNAGEERGWFFANYKWQPATRALWQHLVGRIPAGLELDHLCRNTICVNPDHLEPVTTAENIRRSFSASGLNRRKSACHRGHPFNRDNTYVNPQGHRVCRECQRGHQRRHRERTAA